jgi:hypothetical protein
MCTFWYDKNTPYNIDMTKSSNVRAVRAADEQEKPATLYCRVHLTATLSFTREDVTNRFTFFSFSLFVSLLVFASIHS